MNETKCKSCGKPVSNGIVKCRKCLMTPINTANNSKSNAPYNNIPKSNRNNVKDKQPNSLFFTKKSLTTNNSTKKSNLISGLGAILIAVMIPGFCCYNQLKTSKNYSTNYEPSSKNDIEVTVSSSRSALIGQCAFNPSDEKYLGRVLDIGREGINAYKEKDPGQFAVIIDNPEVGQLEVTYPRFLKIRPCK